MRATLSPPDVTAASGGAEDAPFVPMNRREGYTRQGSRSVEVGSVSMVFNSASGRAHYES